MHILILPSWYPQFNGDIYGSFFREQAIALKKAGHLVGVIYPQIRSLKNIKKILKKPYGLTVENDEGVNTLRWYSINFFPKIKNYNKNHWVKIGLRLFEAYIKIYGKPDIIHVHSMLNASFLAKIIQEKYNIPYVITEHSSAFARNLISKEIMNELRPVVNQASRCLAVSQNFCQYLNGQFTHSDWEYIPNIVNDNFFKQNITESAPHLEKKRIISISNLNKNKNTELLIQAFSQFIRQSLIVDVELIIGGDGEEREALENLVKELDLVESVKFLGSLTRESVKAEIQKSSMFVISSHYETFGVVAIEALALGKPVLSTKCGGPESIVTPKVGILVENNSVDDLARGMLYLYEHLNDYHPNQLKDYCLENFSEQAIVSKLTQVYSEYCGPNE